MNSYLCQKTDKRFVVQALKEPGSLMQQAA
jgi:hypothetical protein